MSRTQVTWGQLKRYCDRHGFAIHPSGGDKIIVCPKGWRGGLGRHAVLIGHRCCSHRGSVVFDCYLSKLHRNFGLTRDELLA